TYQRGRNSESSCFFASNQSELASPGRSSRCLRSEMKYARSRISSSLGWVAEPAALAGFVFRAPVPAFAALAFFSAAGGRRPLAFTAFISGEDPSPAL